MSQPSRSCSGAHDMPSFNRVKENFLKRLASERNGNSRGVSRSTGDRDHREKTSRTEDDYVGAYDISSSLSSKQSESDDECKYTSRFERERWFKTVSSLESSCKNPMFRTRTTSSPAYQNHPHRIKHTESIVSSIRFSPLAQHDAENDDLCNVDDIVSREEEMLNCYVDEIKKSQTAAQIEALRGNSYLSVTSGSRQNETDDESKDGASGSNMITKSVESSRSNRSSSVGSGESAELLSLDEELQCMIESDFNINDNRINPLEESSPTIPSVLSKSRALLCKLLRMQAASGKDPMCRRYDRSSSISRNEEDDCLGQTYYCSGSAETSSAEAVEAGNIIMLLKSQVEMLQRITAMLPMEDGDNFLKSTDTGAYSQFPKHHESENQISPFSCNSMGHIVDMLTATVLSEDHSGDNDTRAHFRLSARRNLNYRYANCEESSPKSEELLHSNDDEAVDVKLCAQLQVTTGSLALLSLTGRIIRAEQRIVALRRLYHKKSARVSECEDKLLDAFEKSQKSTLEIDQLKLRIGSLQESLNYHRVAADRIQTLEESLVRAEAEKEAALESSARLERRLKRSESMTEMKAQEDVMVAEMRARRVRRLEEEDFELLSDSDGDECNERFAQSQPLSRGTRRRDESKAEFSSTSERSRRLKQLHDDETVDPKHRLLDTLRAASAQSVDPLFVSYSDEELSVLGSALSSVAQKVEEAKRLSIERKEKALADSKLSNVENALCCVCRDAVKTILLLPCRHLCLCEDCSDSLTRQRCICPVCRGAVRDTLKVYA